MTNLHGQSGIAFNYDKYIILNASCLKVHVITDDVKLILISENCSQYSL